VKAPPARAFLEKHIDNATFLDFVSRRSPVWKERSLPETKEKAIDLMLEQPNLIKRPILVAGSQVIFGFDKARYEALTQPGYRAIVRTGDPANR
jgi:arsenate reductase-like glutaredoxin family protein